MSRPLRRGAVAGAGGTDLPEALRALLPGAAGADEERALLERGVDTLAALLHRAYAARDTVAPRREGPEETKKEAKRRRARALARSPLPQFELDAELVVRAANPAAARLCGVALEAMPGQRALALLEPLEAEKVGREWREQLARAEPVAQRLACTAKDGRALACDWVCTPLLRADGTLAGARALVRDETARVEQLETVREREERAALALGGAGDVLWDWDLARGRLWLSPRWARLLGLPAPASDKPGEWLDRVHPDDLAPLRAAIDAHLEGRAPALEHEHRVRHADGTWRWLAARGAAAREGSAPPARLAGLFTDVTRHRLLVDRMAHDARHDALTGLPNRTLFLDLLRHSFNRTRRHESYRFAVLFIDLDGFKGVNDAHGHDTGDELLVEIARRLEGCLREGDTLARHAGDEFTMWLDDVRGAADAQRVAERVHEAMREPFALGGQIVRSSASIGVAIGSRRYQRAEAVLRDADAAMYRAKAQGKSRTAFFEPEELEAERAADPQLQSDLRGAVLRKELRVHYLPIVSVATGAVEGFEALARWQHPKLGLVPPAQFLPLAVESGQMAAIDQWVLQTASRQLHDWRAELGEAAGLRLSVNLSQGLLEQKDLPSQIDRVLREAGLAPKDLALDLSEASLASSGPPPLAELRKRGLTLHGDDFGTGQGWLRQLHSGELDSVKIDRSLVAALSGADDRKVLRSMVALARGAGKKVIAEGVETAEQLRWVSEAGCDSAQGFYFSAPLDGLRARGLLKRGRAPAA